MPRKIVQERQAAVASVVKLHNDHAEEVDWLLRKEARAWFEENFEFSEPEDEGETLHTILSEVDRDWLERQFERDPRFNPEHCYVKSSYEDFVFAMEEKIKAWLFSRGITERQYELFWEQENFRDVIVPFAKDYERGRRGAQSCPSKRYKPILARFLDAEPKAAPPDYSRSRLSFSVKSPRATLRTGVLMATPELIWCRYRGSRFDPFADNAFLVFFACPVVIVHERVIKSA